MKIKSYRISITDITVYLTILGYWYNLPVISTGIFGGYNEFRLYDITFFVLLIILFKSNNLNYVLYNIKFSQPLKYLYRFSIWASIMVIPTVIYSLIKSNLIYIGMTLIFIYHLWGFLLLASFVKAYYDGIRLERLIRWFLLLSTIHLFLYYAQISGLLGQLWNERYIQAYGEKAFSGTLGPNRITPGMMTLLGFIMSIFVLQKKFGVKYLKHLAVINIVMALPAIVMIGSRTTFVGIVTFLIIYIFAYKKILIPAFLFVVPLLILLYANFLNDKQKERINENFEYNKYKLLSGENISELNVVEAYENIGSNRYQILTRYVPFLIENPHIIPFGSGFNNRMYAMVTGAASAHNIYLSLINEVGVVGLVVYMQWLFSYLGLMRKYNKEGYIHPGMGLISALVISMIITLFAGEHIYVYRPCFAIMGTFLFVVTSILIIIEEDYDYEYSFT